MSDATSILIVDDEAPARARLREVLADLAPEFPHRIVGEASNAPEALAQIESQRPQVVLMDVQMPGMTGIELARHISARGAEGDGTDPKPMPLIIFVTAFDEFAVNAFEVNALDYLLKPVRAREREYLIEESLTSLEEEFNDRFVRIHRNALVARPSIAGFERVSPSGEGESGDPYWQVVLREVPDRLPVSRRQWSIVKGLVS